MVADGFDTQMIPIVGLGDLAIQRGERFSMRAGRAVIGQDIAAAALFIIDAARECFAFEIGIDFHLVTVNVAFAHVQGFALPFKGRRFVRVSAADLQAAVDARVDLEIEFEDKIIVVLCSEEKTVGATAGNVHLPDDAAVLDEVGGVAGFLRPTGEVFAIEQINPCVFGQNRLCREEGDCQECGFEVLHKCSVTNGRREGQKGFG